MRLAVLADIHALLPALDAALAEIEPLQVDGIIVAGDMLTGPSPAETIKRLQELGCWMIRGNNENYLLRFLSADAPDWWYTSQQWAFTRWNFQQLDSQSLELIASLPEQRTIHLPGTDPIRVVHGSPRNISELIYPDKDLGLLDLALTQVPEPVVIFGHTHRSWQMLRNGRLALNPGALSGNFTGKVSGGYAILDWETNHWSAELREVDLDLDLVRKSYQDSGLLEAAGAVASYWLRSIEAGTDLLPRFLDYAFEMARRAGYTDTPSIPDHILEQADNLFAAELQKINPTFDLSGFKQKKETP
jgi:putative phosphoesterase